MEFLIILVLIVLNGVFSMSEVALISARRPRLDADAQKGDSKAAGALKLAEKPEKFFATVQVGITLIGIMTGLFGGAALAAQIERPLSKVSWIEPYSGSVASAIVVIGITYVTLILGELVPKQIGIRAPETISKIVARPMSVLSRIVSPFISLLNVSTNFVLRLFGVKSGQESTVTEDEIKAMVRQGALTGTIEPFEHRIVERVFHLGDRNVSSIMTPRADIVWIDANMSREQMLELIASAHHNVFPFCHGELDAFVGFAYLKDIFSMITKTKIWEPTKVVKPAQFVSESMKVYNVLEMFKQHSVHDALVLDEYGVLIGMVTLQDIMDSLVGTVAQGVNTEQSIVERRDGSYLIDAHLSMYDFVIYFNLDAELASASYNTVGGLILSLSGNIPSEGQCFSWETFEFEIVDMDGMRIDKVIARKIAASSGVPKE